MESLIPYHQWFRVTDMSHLQQLSLEWLSHAYGTGSQDEEVAVSVIGETSLSVVASGDFAELSIYAPRAASLSWRKDLGRRACKECSLLEKVEWEAVGPKFERYERNLKRVSFGGESNDE